MEKTVDEDLVSGFSSLNFVDLILVFVIAILSCILCIGGIIGVSKYNQMRRERDSAISQRTVMHNAIEQGDTKTFAMLFGIKTKLRRRTRGTTHSKTVDGISMQRVDSTECLYPTETNVDRAGGEEHHDDDGNTKGPSIDLYDMRSISAQMGSMMVHQRLITANHGHEGLPLNVAVERDHEPRTQNGTESAGHGQYGVECVVGVEELEMDRQISKELFGDHHARNSFVSTKTGGSTITMAMQQELPDDEEVDDEEADGIEQQPDNVKVMEMV